MVAVKFSELSLGFEFASFAGTLDNGAFINLDTGTIHYKSNEIELDEELPEDIETSDRYLAIPQKNELELGRTLALSFIDERLPNDYDIVAGFFRSRGAYSRFKSFLEGRGVINQWFEYESNATDIALRQWCIENDIQLVD